MSFDLFLIPFCNGEPGQGDFQAAQTILERHTHRRDADHFDIKFEDGSQLELFSNLSRSAARGMICLRGSSQKIGEFIFEYASAGKCAVIVAMDPPTVLLPRDGMETDLPSNVRSDFRLVRVENGTEVLAAISGGYVDWERYRDHVIGLGKAKRDGDE